jgi:hypothetical protein
MENMIFWVVSPFSSEISRRFGGEYLLLLQLAANFCWFLTLLTLEP